MDFWPFKRLFKNLKKYTNKLVYYFFDDLNDCYQELFYYFPKRVIRFLKTLMQYIPHIWKTFEWDSDILNTIELRLTIFKKHIEKHGYHVNVKKDIKNLNKALELIQKLKDEDNYYDEDKKEFEQKWGKSIWYREDHLLNDKHDGSYRIMSRFEKETNENSNQIRKEQRQMYKKSAARYNKDWNKLWALLNKELRNWWC